MTLRGAVLPALVLLGSACARQVGGGVTAPAVAASGPTVAFTHIAERTQGPPVPWATIVPGLLVLQREIHATGVRMLPGTDVATALLYPGFSLHEELEQMVRHLGMTPAEALVSATRYPAEFFGMQDSLGTIVPGKLADLVLLDADPLVDIRNTTKISGVVANGRYLDRAALDALLTAARKAGLSDIQHEQNEESDEDPDHEAEGH